MPSSSSPASSSPVPTVTPSSTPPDAPVAIAAPHQRNSELQVIYDSALALTIALFFCGTVLYLIGPDLLQATLSPMAAVVAAVAVLVVLLALCLDVRRR